jgi:hypothetical protein
MAKLNTTTSGIITATLTADSSPNLELQQNGVTFRTLGSAITSSDLSTEVVPIGVNQTWLNVTSSRALSTTYTNTTGKPIQLYIVCTGGNSNGAAVTIGGVSPAQLYTNVAGGRVAFFVIIPNGVTCKFNDSLLVGTSLRIKHETLQRPKHKRNLCLRS